ncbi:NADPH-dependent F420 reductase [Actinoplanes subtropicus]|uniref:NADPH-dependent F420 reductase n=1 Tax=Actinoplanes subtropicus TaxID=543632 RepID=UPI0004C2CD27|nr:NAD(P)-binding domain-containing protein [Actinoplanes subtropicus]
MARGSSFTVGTIGAGNVAQAVARRAAAAGHRVVLSNSRGPASLALLVERLGPLASAGTVADAAQADLAVLAVRWHQVPDAVGGFPAWDGRIVIDATNQWKAPGVAIDLGDQTGSERNAALMPGARVVKAFNTLFSRIVVQDPRRADGNLVVVLAGDDAEAKATVSAFVESMGFAPIDIGDLRTGRLMQVGGGPLVGQHLVKLAS